MKVKLFTLTEDDQSVWLDFWIDEIFITGCYVPVDFDNDVKTINVRYDGDFMTFQQEQHLLDFLDERFNIR